MTWTRAAPPLSIVQMTMTHKPSISVDTLLLILEASEKNARDMTTYINSYAEQAANRLKAQRKKLTPAFLADCKAEYDRRLTAKDEEVFKKYKATADQVSEALAYYRSSDDRVKELVEAVTAAGPKFEFEPDELLAQYKDIIEVQLQHMEAVADELAEAGLIRGSKPFQTTMARRMQKDGDEIKARCLAEKGLDGADTFLELNLELYCKNHNTVAIKFNQILSEQEARTIKCGAKSAQE